MDPTCHLIWRALEALQSAGCSNSSVEIQWAAVHGRDLGLVGEGCLRTCKPWAGLACRCLAFLWEACRGCKGVQACQVWDLVPRVDLQAAQCLAWACLRTCSESRVLAPCPWEGIPGE